MLMRNDGDILVVGTTADYVEWIENRSRSDAVFLTASKERERASERYLRPEREILADLQDSQECLSRVRGYLDSSGTTIASIACFDDESLPLAAVLARELGLEFPSVESIRLCLDKHLAKEAWQEAHVPCPRAVAVSSSAGEIEEGGIGFPCVLKPHSGSGSEGVFLCNTLEQARQGVAQILASGKGTGANSTAVAEELVSGTEFSCDFAVSDAKVEILRTARKHMTSNGPVGTTMAYILPSQLSPEMRDGVLPGVLLRAAEALGISRAICMADFIADGEKVFLLEISPRPGGDCLPHILLEAWGIDAIGGAMAFSRGDPAKPWLSESAPTVIGLRVFAPGPGRMAAVDTHRIEDDPRVISHHLNDGCGRVVILPPKDYSSWLLGHVIFQPYAGTSVEDQIHEIRANINVRLEDAVA